MSDLLLPTLKQADWSGRTKAVCRPVMPDIQSPFMPLLAFGYDHPHTFEFLTLEKLAEMGRSIEEIEQIALNNLRQRPVKWDEQVAELGGGAALRILIGVDDYYAAEHILNPDFTRDAQLILETELLAIGIPCRSYIIATSGIQQQEVLGTFAALVSAQFYRGDSTPITPAVFGVQNGSFIGMLSGGEESGRKMVEEQEYQTRDNLYLSGMEVPDSEGKVQVEILVGSPDLHKMAGAILGAFNQTLNDFISREDFGGKIHIRIIPSIVPDSPVLRQMMATMTAHLQGIALDIARTMGAEQPVTVELYYGTETLLE